MKQGRTSLVILAALALFLVAAGVMLLRETSSTDHLDVPAAGSPAQAAWHDGPRSPTLEVPSAPRSKNALAEVPPGFVPLGEVQVPEPDGIVRPAIPTRPPIPARPPMENPGGVNGDRPPRPVPGVDPGARP